VAAGVSPAHDPDAPPPWPPAPVVPPEPVAPPVEPVVALLVVVALPVVVLVAPAAPLEPAVPVPGFVDVDEQATIANTTQVVPNVCTGFMSHLVERLSWLGDLHAALPARQAPLVNEAVWCLGDTHRRDRRVEGRPSRFRAVSGVARALHERRTSCAR
jgi:hypothetical protein